jgi:hypothetical protein
MTINLFIFDTIILSYASSVGTSFNRLYLYFQFLKRNLSRPRTSSSQEHTHLFNLSLFLSLSLSLSLSRRTGATLGPLGLRTFLTKRANTIKALPRIQPDARNSKFLPPLQGISLSISHSPSLSVSFLGRSYY